MRTIIVDDDLLAMQGFRIECKECKEIDIVGEFSSPLDALEYAKINQIDFALLDIEMPGMDGLELAGKLRDINEQMIIVFVTSYTKATVAALKFHADGIVLKPYTKEDITYILERSKLLKARLKKPIYCKTFGEFDVFINGEPIAFRLAKSKELFAICVERRGGVVSSREIIDKMWGSYYQSVGDCSGFRIAVKEIKDILKGYGFENAFIRNRNQCQVNTDYIDSDYYNFLDGNQEAICNFQGELFGGYKWAMPRNDAMLEKKEIYKKK